MQSHTFFIENILMFMPFDILVPIALSKIREFVRCTAVAFVYGVLLKGIQFITGRGFCELDDIVTNTISTMIDYILYKILLSKSSLFFR